MADTIQPVHHGERLAIWHHDGTNSRIVADFISRRLGIPAATWPIPANVLIIICPTWGDEEVHPSFEDALESWEPTASAFAVCELGNYYGFEDKEFGASKIIREVLRRKGLRDTLCHLSLDSVPVIDYTSLEKWTEMLSTRLKPFLDDGPAPSSTVTPASPWT